MTKIAKFLSLWMPPILWASIIFIVSSYPTKTVSQIYWPDFVVKKTAHIVEYAILSALIYRGLKEGGVEKKNAGIIAVTLSVIYGATDEMHQSLIPGRTSRIRDVIFDTIGSGLAIYTIWNLLPKAPKRLRKWAENLQLL